MRMIFLGRALICPMSAKVSPQSAAILDLGAKGAASKRRPGMGCRQFLEDENGAVTVDWVVLTAGVVVFAVIVMPPIQTAIVEMAVYIGDTITEYSKFLE
jgi:Flp pilus assembly pilin Flp